MRPKAKHSGRKERRDSSGGFTLVELLVVLVVLSLVMGLVGPRVLGYLTDARTRSASLQIDSLQAALDLFFLDLGRYPSQAEGLEALVEQKSGLVGWNGPYLQQSELPKDPWGNSYQYKVPGPGAKFTIVSLGSDGREGGDSDAADIVSR